MCLEKVIAIYDKIDPTISYGYKIYKIVGNKISNVYQNKYINIRVGIWYNDTNINSIASKESIRSFRSFLGTELEILRTPILYPPGFHIFTSKSDAEKYARLMGIENYKVLRVKYKNTVAEGLDKHKIHSIIARSILILPGQYARSHKKS